MIVDPHSFQIPLLCLVWKSAPNLLWSLGGAADNQLLQMRKHNPALIARVSLMSLFAHAEKPGLSKWLGAVTRLGYHPVQ